MKTIDEICQANGDKLVLVNIKKSYRAFIGKDTKDRYYRPSLKDCTSKYWAIGRSNIPRLKEATHILGCSGGFVKCVIAIKDYHTQVDGEYNGRYVFEGDEQCNSPYIGKDIRPLFDNLANFKVKFYGL